MGVRGKNLFPPACGAKFYFGFLWPHGRTIAAPAARVQPGRELALRRGYICHFEFAARTPISAELWPEPQDLVGAEQLKTRDKAGEHYLAAATFGNSVTR